MRQSFADFVRATGVNYTEENRILMRLLTGKAYLLFSDGVFMADDCFGTEADERSFFDVCDIHFEKFDLGFRGSSRCCEDFIKYHKIYFKQNDVELDDLLFLMEYALTLASHLNKALSRDDYSDRIILNHISAHLSSLVDRLSHSVIMDDQFVKLVPSDVVLAEVAAAMPKEVSIQTFLYRHRSLCGKIEEKRAALAALGAQLEPKRAVLSLMNHKLSDDVFMLLNNMNIRHNNITSGSPNFRPYVASLTSSDLEMWYDKLYEMMIAAFSMLNVGSVMSDVEKAKARIVACK